MVQKLCYLTNSKGLIHFLLVNYLTFLTLCRDQDNSVFFIYLFIYFVLWIKIIQILLKHFE